MYFAWNAPLSKVVILQEKYGTKDLRFYGISIGWIGLGFIVGIKHTTASAEESEK